MGNCCSKKQQDSDTSHFPVDLNTLGFRTFEGKVLPCKVIEVYDGDTITVVTRLHELEPWAKYKLRIYGIDAPEMKPKLNVLNRELHIAGAHHVKDYVHSLIINQVFCIRFYKEEKFGRLMGDIILKENLTLSEQLIKMKLVKPYKGEAKTEFTKAELETILSVK